MEKIEPENLNKFPKDTVFVICCQYGEEVKRQLEDLGFYHIFWINDIIIDTYQVLHDSTRCEDYINNIGDLFELCEDEKSRFILSKVLELRVTALNQTDGYNEIYSPYQYFEPDIVQLSNNEVFIDCGAYDGDTVDEFIKTTSATFNKIYAFEMDESNYQNMLHRFQNYPDEVRDRIIGINKGVSSKREKIKYCSSDTSSRIDSINGEKIAIVDKIDDMVDYSEEVSFICMDIEGAEIEALKGARKTILKHKPKLAISIYHNINHIWEIPKLIQNMLPEYKFYIRHHNLMGGDTVLYAIK